MVVVIGELTVVTVIVVKGGAYSSYCDSCDRGAYCSYCDSGDWELTVVTVIVVIVGAYCS